MAMPTGVSHDGRRFPGQQAGDMGDPGLDDPGLFGSDSLQRSPENFHVVEADVGDDGGQRFQHVGGIEPPAEADLDDRDINMSAGEVIEGEGGYQLKEREFFFTSVRRWASTKALTARRGIISPSTFTRSRKSTRCGEV